MRLALVAIGRLKAGPERALADRYVERARALARPLGLSGPDVSEIAEARARRAADRRGEEAAALASRLAEGAVVVLDERGRALDSPGFAGRLESWRRRGAGRPRPS